MDHLQQFQQKHNVGVITLELLALFAVQNNVLAAYSMYPGA